MTELIPIENLVIMYPNPGDNDKSGRNPNRLGICEAIGLQTVKGKLFIDVAQLIKEKLNEQSTNPSILAIKDHMNRGVEGIYTYQTYDNEKIMLARYDDGLFSVVGGNHRVFALVLLGEKEIKICENVILLEESNERQS